MYGYLGMCRVCSLGFGIQGSGFRVFDLRLRAGGLAWSDFSVYPIANPRQSWFRASGFGVT